MREWVWVSTYVSYVCNCPVSCSPLLLYLLHKHNAVPSETETEMGWAKVDWKNYFWLSLFKHVIGHFHQGVDICISLVVHFSKNCILSILSFCADVIQCIIVTVLYMPCQYFKLSNHICILPLPRYPYRNHYDIMVVHWFTLGLWQMSNRRRYCQVWCPMSDHHQ